MRTTRWLAFALVLATCSWTGAQEMSPTARQSQPIPPSRITNNVPLYRIQVVGREIPAINYWHRSGSTQIGFAGTSLLPGARGEAKITSKSQTFLDATFKGLVPANSFGVEYLTYVLWAITPQGRPVNLGEVIPHDGKAEMKVTTSLQQFALVVTAEPYFAVTMPSDLVVLQNTVSKGKTTGIIDTVNVHYNLLPRGAYTQTAGRHTVLNPVQPSDKSPLQIYEAINAVQIARAAGAGQYAPEILSKAQQELNNAQALSGRKSQRKVMITYARGAVQDAEDARVSALRRFAELQQQQQRQQQQQAMQQAQLVAQQQAVQRAQAQAETAQAEARAAEARTAQALAEHSAQQATDQTEQMRESLRRQLNAVLQTRETARGLIVNMSDVLFGFNQYTLKPEAREKLAKVSGILAAYPGLTLQVEGYTDNIGSEPYNLKLSQQRADAVRDYLISQDVAAPSVTATGYGASNPIADNSTAAGRAKNRRVQLVVSGNAIGVHESAPSTTNQEPLPQGISNPPPQ